VQKRVVLLYHHVCNSDKTDNIYTVTEKNFKCQLANLQRFTHIVRSKELVQRVSSQKKLHILITFDDGWEDNVSVALPLLQQYRLSALMFVSSDKVGTPGFVTWDQLKQWLNAGMEIGSHGCDHLDFSQLNEPQIVYELNRSKEVLEQRLGIAVETFAYPYAIPITSLEKAMKIFNVTGYRYAFIAGNKPVQNDCTTFEIPRYYY
jgi:peptidoglycan/xylan/chitin deacetylase (PgdA/CDA1 family)